MKTQTFFTKTIILFLILSVMLAGCLPMGRAKVADKTVEEEVQIAVALTQMAWNATQEAKPTSTPKPTATPKPTNTPAPTATPEFDMGYYLQTMDDVEQIGIYSDSCGRKLSNADIFNDSWKQSVYDDMDKIVELAYQVGHRPPPPEMQKFSDEYKGVYEDLAMAEEYMHQGLDYFDIDALELAGIYLKSATAKMQTATSYLPE